MTTQLGTMSSSVQCKNLGSRMSLYVCLGREDREVIVTKYMACESYARVPMQLKTCYKVELHVKSFISERI
ncbi:hypothetical protein TNCV_617361 [Trichonephila clavipes]|nr:hypothetical protein TNCV_617361 [Trichonephila clavipes]